MPRFPRGLIGLAASAVFALGAGCEGGKPSVDTSTEQATVKGVVTFKGKPVTKGEIAFDPSNYQRKSASPQRAKIGPDGSYSLKTLVGDNTVSFSIPQTARDPLLQDLLIPRDVQSGENTFNFDLPPSADPATP